MNNVTAPSTLQPTNNPSSEITDLIEKTALRTVQSQNPFEFEGLIRKNQLNNPHFGFLFPGHPWNTLYEWKKNTLKSYPPSMMNAMPIPLPHPNIIMQHSLQPLPSTLPIIQPMVQSHIQPSMNMNAVLNNNQLLSNNPFMNYFQPQLSSNIPILPPPAINPSTTLLKNTSSVIPSIITTVINSSLTDKELNELQMIFQSLNCSIQSINYASKWIITHKTSAMQVCNQIKSYINNLTTKTKTNINEIFDKKLHICFVLNDVLHECVKSQRIAIEKLDNLSQHISNALFFILPNTFSSAMNAKQKQKLLTLLNLWQSRKIFSTVLIQRLTDAMNGKIEIGSKSSNVSLMSSSISNIHRLPVMPFMNSGTTANALKMKMNLIAVQQKQQLLMQNIPKILTKDTLHLPIGKIKDFALRTRRTGGGGVYVTLAMEKLEVDVKSNENGFEYDYYVSDDDDIDVDRYGNMNSAEKTKFDKMRVALQEFQREMCFIDDKRCFQPNYVKPIARSKYFRKESSKNTP